MPVYQLNYLSRPGACEIVDADCPDDAEDLARRRLLFSEPGFTIAIMFEGVELNRVTQRAKAPGLRFSLLDRVGRSPARANSHAIGDEPRFSELSR